jgi:hypothetical protein
VLLRLAYLAVTNTFAVLRLLPISARDKDVEILALRHQITVLNVNWARRRYGSTRAIGRASGHGMLRVGGQFAPGWRT